MYGRMTTSLIAEVVRSDFWGWDNVRCYIMAYLIGIQGRGTRVDFNTTSPALPLHTTT